MSTKLIDAVDLVKGVLTSDSITDVGDLVLDVELTVPAPNDGILIKLKAKEGNNNYKDISDEGDINIFWVVGGKTGLRKNIVGINTENLILELTSPSGVSGKVTVEYTKTTNPNT